LIRLMRLMEQHGETPSLSDLIAVADRAGEREVAARLQSFDPDIDPDIAIDKLDVLLAEQAAADRREIHTLAEKGSVVLVGPLPPHIHEAFVRHEGCLILFPEDEHIPHHLHNFPASRIIWGTRNCRTHVSAADILVFEAFRNGQYLLAAEVADLVDERIIRPSARLLVHLRPHLHHDDITLADALGARLERY
jgi:hypothetical protein